MSSHICRLKVDHFRGIESLTWYPTKGINIILGGGDTGKTTILDAIGLLLYPTNTYNLTDADYWKRDVASEFLIEAVMSLADVVAISQQSKMNWPWEWDSENPVLPKEEAGDDQGRKLDQVYVLRVRGTSDLELAYEILQPDDSVDNLSVALRRAIGLVRLSGDDRNDRDLRLVQGSGLDRLLGDKGLRSRLAKELGTQDVKSHLNSEAMTVLNILEASFGKRALPSKLGLGITGGPGTSLNALVGLTADKDGTTLPLANWGAGTRRLAALTIADALQGDRPITIVDEIERGLEPYRQRALMAALKTGGAQVFVTTHSAAVLSAISDAALWYMDAKGHLGQLPNDKIARHRKSDPETFLARLAIVCEGATEVGFTSALIAKALNDFPENYGIWITDGQGHDSSLQLLEALSAGHLDFAGMVDTEGRGSGTWAKIKDILGDLLLQWPNGCLEQYVISLFEPEKLHSLIKDPEGKLTGMRLRSLAERLGIETTDIENIKTRAGERLSQFIIEAATGTVPEKCDNEKYNKKHFQGHASCWFKSKEGGRELAEKVFALGVWPKLKPEALKFLNAIRKTVGLPTIEDLTG